MKHRGCWVPVPILWPVLWLILVSIPALMRIPTGVSAIIALRRLICPNSSRNIFFTYKCLFLLGFLVQGVDFSPVRHNLT